MPLYLSAISFNISSPTIPLKLTLWNVDLQMMPKNPNFYNIYYKYITLGNGCTVYDQNSWFLNEGTIMGTNDILKFSTKSADK